MALRKYLQQFESSDYLRYWNLDGLLDDNFLINWNLYWNDVRLRHVDDFVDRVWVRLGDLYWVWNMDWLSL